MISTTDSVESIVCHISLNASTGLFPEIRSAIDEMMIAAAVAAKGASEARQIRSNISDRLRSRPGHVRPEIGRRDRRRIEVGDDTAPEHDEQAV